jgi:hypothetical protein
LATPSVHTIGGTLWHWPLAASTAHADAVDNVALLGLVAQAAGLVGARGAGGAVDDIQLSELYYALSAKFSECIAGASSKERCPHAEPTTTTSPNLLMCPGLEQQIRSLGGASMARSGSSRVEISYLPAAHAQKEAQHIGLLLLLELFDVFEGTHLHKELARGDGG